MTTEKLVKLYPTGNAYILGEPAEEREVTEAEAKRLLRYDPPAYTTDKPKDPASAGSSDSKGEKE